MEEEIQMYLDDAKEQMEKSIKHFEAELIKIRAGKAMPNMLDGLSFEYYGAMTPLTQAASVSTPDARTLVIKPFEKKIIPDIEKAIINSNLGFNPQNDGDIIRIGIPPLTEERRKELVKQAKGEGEKCKVSLRNIRKESNNSLKSLQKEGASEDAIKDAEDSVQDLTNSFSKKCDEILSVKEAEIMHV